MHTRRHEKVDPNRSPLAGFLLACLATFAIAFGALELGGCKSVEDGGTFGNGQLDIPGGPIVQEVAGLVADVGIPLYLRNNPHALPALEAVIASLDTLYGKQLEITPEVIKSFTAKLAAQHGLQPSDEAVIGGILFRGYKLYRAYVPVGPITVETEQGRVFLGALRDQLAEGVAFYRAFYAAG